MIGRGERTVLEQDSLRFRYAGIHHRRRCRSISLGQKLQILSDGEIRTTRRVDHCDRDSSDDHECENAAHPDRPSADVSPHLRAQGRAVGDTDLRRPTLVSDRGAEGMGAPYPRHTQGRVRGGPESEAHR